MSLPPPIFDGFFRNPFGGEMNPVGGMGGEGGVLENIQQQVSENGQALQALQGGIGGLPNTPFRPSTRHPIGHEKIAYENPGELPNLLDFNPPSITDAATDIDAQIRADYDKAVADAKRQRAEGFLGRVQLPGEMSFEDFKKMQIRPNADQGPIQSDIFNIAQVEQNPGIGLIQDSGISNITGDLFGDINTGPLQTLDSTGNRGYTDGGLPPVFIDGVNVNQNPTPSMDQLFGRAFAGKPV